MAAEAGALYLGMIDLDHRQPGCGQMAGLADGRGLDMPNRFTGRAGAVVAARAVAGYRAVVEGRRNPGRGAVTVIAGGGTWNMIGALAGSC